MKTRPCRKSPPSARERAVFAPGKDGEAGDIDSIVDGAGCSQAQKGPLEARATLPKGPGLLWKFFGALILLILLAIVILTLVVSQQLGAHFEEKVTEKLLSNANVVGDVLKADLQARDYQGVERVSRRYAQELGVRITVIDPDGKVLTDSDRASEDLDNHGNRLEVQQALSDGIGQSTRTSDTLGQMMKYVAVRLDQEQDLLGVIRFALPRSEFKLDIRAIYQAVFLGATLAIAITSTIAYVISKSITSPITELRRAAHRLAKGKLDNRIQVQQRDELGQLAE